MLKTFTVLGAISIIGLSVVADTPAYAGGRGGKVCFRDEAGVRQCVSKREARQLLRQQNHRPTIVVDARDGPMPKTRDAAIRAQESGATSIKVLFENIELVGDAELVQLSKLETMELLANHGFSGNRVVFRECMLSC